MAAATISQSILSDPLTAAYGNAGLTSGPRFVAKDMDVLRDAGSGFDMGTFNKYLKLVIVKGTSALADGPWKKVTGIGMLSPGVSALLNLIFESPSEGEDLIIQKLDMMGNKLDKMTKQMDQDTLASSISNSLTAVRNTANHIDAWWQRILKAHKNGDEHAFCEIARAVGAETVNGAAMQLSDLHKVFVGNNPTTSVVTFNGTDLAGPLLTRVCALLYNRVDADEHHLYYDYIKYSADLQKWCQYAQDIQNKGSALLIMYQTFRLLSGENYSPKSGKISLSDMVGMNIQDIRDENNVRLTDYASYLSSGPGEYKASKILSDANAHNKDLPDLYTLRIEDTVKYLAARRVFNQAKPQLTFQPLPQGESLSLAYAFNFTRKRNGDQDSGVWHLHTSRYRVRREEAPASTICRNDDDPWHGDNIATDNLGWYRPLTFGLFGRNYVETKLIPRPDKDGQARMRLCFIDKAGIKSLARYDLIVTPYSVADSIAFTTAPDPKTSLLFYDTWSQRINLWVNNLSPDHVLVLQDHSMYDEDANDLYYHGIVWQAGQRAFIGVRGNMYKGYNELTLRLRAFKLYKSRRDPSKREDLHDLITLDKTGRVSLKNAERVSDIFIKIWNSADIFSKNYISAVTVPVDGPYKSHANYGIEDAAILKDLDDACTSQNYPKEHGDATLRTVCNISGGTRTEASVDISAVTTKAA